MTAGAPTHNAPESKDPTTILARPATGRSSSNNGRFNDKRKASEETGPGRGFGPEAACCRKAGFRRTSRTSGEVTPTGAPKRRMSADGTVAGTAGRKPAATTNCVACWECFQVLAA